ncbi:MucB/RseB C-terminal domain-containing protein [Metapseudomonas furukawaii]|uniref:Sigma factor RpoE negative regulatory protein RseB n=1 Tax=Metapseudomonas furukawaii TaxID=1149133 RepID=A0AAD1BXU1_METFU|nr:MucB/RseB C-terminal domain-containing protein [Pseudomonas furukawaii]ELS27984.1 Sigma factor RpoE negative regulatory protein RseB precursor [Pseudomonas furukawaii]WAG80394.1 MucB/RseB C-terminal domain-containing protein [Pseudomonas furukawaii]BAU73035.1 sigma factor RpoE negative regulatory protein RseB precursor [Pseudomonas furukawaii]
MRALPVIILLGGWLTQTAHAADAQDWLQRLADAEQRQSFQGTFVYERNGSFSTHQVWHQVRPGGEVRERLLQLDGPAQEVLRVNGRTQCVTGALSDQMADGQAWPARALDARQLSEWYDLKVAGESRVAGRSATVLTLTPRDQHRYGFELHLDRDTGLPLKSLLLSDRAHLLERLQFTRVDTASAIDDADLQPSAACKAVRSSEAATDAPARWRSDWLPPGFSLTSAQERRSPASSEAVSSLLYSDGLARFSVFLEPLHGTVVEDARSQLGPTVMVSKRISTAEGDVMVTVVGEIPLGTAERVALSMRAAEATAAQ